LKLLRRHRRAAIVGLLAIALGAGVFAYAATNTVPNGTAGSGSGTISGYTVSSVVYTPNSTTPTNLDQVAFSISPTAATTVKIQLAAAGSWYTCSNTAGSVTCNTTSPQATVAAATQLTVVATQ
jgi:signal peptidase I